MLFSAKDGALLAILNDGHIQHMRVAAIVAIGTKHMARRESHTLGILRSGGMAWIHSYYLSKIRPINKIKVFSPNKDHRQRFVEQLQKALEIEAVEASDPDEVYRGSDIVSACTNANQPIILARQLEEGMHITVNKQREISDDALAD